MGLSELECIECGIECKMGLDEYNRSFFNL